MCKIGLSIFDQKTTGSRVDFYTHMGKLFSRHSSFLRDFVILRERHVVTGRRVESPQSSLERLRVHSEGRGAN